jgi:capsule polysaccharide modification protein KpsS
LEVHRTGMITVETTSGCTRALHNKFHLNFKAF